MITIPMDVAERIVARRMAAAGATIVRSRDPRRLPVVGLVSAANALQGTGLMSDRIESSVTVTLPGLPGFASDVLGMIPVVGHFLSAMGRQNGRTSVYFSPSAERDGVTYLATAEHELGHVGSIHRGGIPYCGAYLLASEVRAGGEAPCYGLGMAVRVACGAEIEEAEAGALESLLGYGLDAESTILARGLIQSAAETLRSTGDFGGVVEEIRRELELEGVTL